MATLLGGSNNRLRSKAKMVSQAAMIETTKFDVEEKELTRTRDERAACSVFGNSETSSECEQLDRTSRLGS
jgi:hypothetical protein